jgi:hypothetical protein
MSQTTTSRLLEPELPGAWIVNRQHIWQMNLLDAYKLANFSHDRGLAYFNENDVIHLWQLGLVKADLIKSRRKLRLVGLVDSGTDLYGNHLYSDERQLPKRPASWDKAVKTLKPLQKGVELLFHPFRYYVIYGIDRMIELHASSMQIFLQEYYPHLVEFSLRAFNNFSRTDNFITSINTWNDVASLAIVTEPCFYERIFHSIHTSLSNIPDLDNWVMQIQQEIAEYWKQHVQKLYQRIGKDRLEEIRQELCVATQMLDRNRWVHTTLCLGQGKFRTESEGRLGGALLLRTMAEMLRRATEETYAVTLREEDELGFGWMPENVKKQLYGSNRLLDGDERAAEEFMRQYKLHYGLRLRFYVEGVTEAEALRYEFQTIGAQFIEVINLGGEVAQKRARGVAFRENLRSDIEMHVFSMVLIDGDRPDFVSAVKKAAKDDEICGCFYISSQDFEFANFELTELEEILWIWALEVDKENTLTKEDRLTLHEAIKDVKNAEELINKAKRALPQLHSLTKGERWGRKLIDFAGEQSVRQGKQRQIVEAIQTAVKTKAFNYQISRREYKVDENTGQPLKRLSPLVE